MPIQTDAIYISDAECGCILAKAKADHHVRTAYLGDAAPAFTDAMAEQALADEVRQRQAMASAAAHATADLADMQAQNAAAAQRAADRLNDWRL